MIRLWLKLGFGFGFGSLRLGEAEVNVVFGTKLQKGVHRRVHHKVIIGARTLKNVVNPHGFENGTYATTRDNGTIGGRAQEDFTTI